MMKNPRYTNEERSGILLDLDDTGSNCIFAEPFGEYAELFHRAITGEFGDVADYVTQPEPDPLLTWRQSATLSRAEFCIALKRAGILQQNEAKQAAKGDWPATFADALADFPDADEAEIIWAAITTVDRMHPMLLALQAFAGISDADLDAMFGWAAA